MNVNNRKWGIYNTRAGCFQFRISADTPAEAMDRLYNLIGDGARRWRFEPRIIPIRRRWAPGTKKSEVYK